VNCLRCKRPFRISGIQDVAEPIAYRVRCPYCDAANEVGFPNRDGMFTVQPLTEES
jgi:hypothetical protein